MVKYYTDGTIVPQEQEKWVRPVRKDRNLKQGSNEQQSFYERVDDIEILHTFMQFGGLD